MEFKKGEKGYGAVNMYRMMCSSHSIVNTTLSGMSVGVRPSFSSSLFSLPATKIPENAKDESKEVQDEFATLSLVALL